MGESIGIRNKRFVAVAGGFGFDQNALKGRWSGYNVDRSCGVAALANLISYEKREFSLDKKDALARMDRILYHAPPRPWGIVGASILEAALENILPQMRLKAIAGHIYGDAARSFIREGLAADKPVALMNTNHPHPGFRYHWVTIIELLYEDGAEFVRFSSWGRRYKLPFDVLLTPKTVYRVLAYLEHKDAGRRV